MERRVGRASSVRGSPVNNMDLMDDYLRTEGESSKDAVNFLSLFYFDWPLGVLWEFRAY